MSENKRYYWLKLNEGFFEDDTISWIEEQENGKAYCLFYLKLCLKSLKTDGLLIRNVGELLIPYDAKKLAEMTNTDIDTVMVAMELFKRIGLIQIGDTGEIFLPQLAELVGSETDSARAMRARRTREKLSDHNVSKMLSQCSEMLREKELEINIDIEQEKDTDIEKERETTTGTEEELDFTTVLCGQIMTTAEEMGKAADYIGRAVRQFWKRDAAEDDVERGFAKCCTMSRQYEQDIGMFDEDKGLMLTCAMSLAAEKGERACNWYYVYAIYANWERLGLHDICAVNQHELERSQR